MHDPGGVRTGQPFSCVLEKSEQLAQFSSLFMNLVAQRLAIHEFHGDEVDAIMLANLIDVRDIRMIEGGGSLCFLGKPPHSILIAGEFRGEKLSRYFPAVLGVFT